MWNGLKYKFGQTKKHYQQHVSRSFTYMGGGGQGCHFEAAFGARLLRGLGSPYQYSALAQEFAGAFWVCGHTDVRQYLHDQPDVN